MTQNDLSFTSTLSKLTKIVLLYFYTFTLNKISQLVVTAQRYYTELYGGRQDCSRQVAPSFGGFLTNRLIAQVFSFYGAAVPYAATLLPLYVGKETLAVGVHITND